MYSKCSLMPILSATLLLTACQDDDVRPQPDAGETSPQDGDASVDSGGSSDAHVSEPVQSFEACTGREFPTEEPVVGRPWTPNAITLVSEELSDGVFVVYDKKAPEYGPKGIPLATSGGFIVGDDGVLLVESMINRRLFCQVADLIRAETDKPLKYVINTSHHGDHSYGNHFLPEGAKVVQHENTAAFIGDSEKFASDVAFMETNFGADQGIDEVRARAADILVGSAGWSVNLGGVEVQALYLGFGQTDGDLFVYVPAADLLFLGNPVVAQKPAIPWLLDGHTAEVLQTLKTLRAKFPRATMVPGHDKPQKPGLFDFDISYLEALVSGTQRAIDAGETVEQASESITLEDYQGYALWDWLHKTVNIPATFAELSGDD